MPDWMRSSGTQVLLIASLALAVLFGLQFYQNQKRLEAQKQIELLDVRVAFGQDERRVSTGVFGTVLNNSEQVIKMLEITIDYLSKEDVSGARAAGGIISALMTYAAAEILSSYLQPVLTFFNYLSLSSSLVVRLSHLL